MARQTKEEKRIDKEIEVAYYKHGTNVEISVLDIGKIYSAGHAASKEGKSVEESVKASIGLYRQN